ncbi:MAG: hypothetical protein IJR87_09320 [Bacteroidaceae bacterium]|nr:hypothetical protein [Bacteroidaceae bacterium]
MKNNTFSLLRVGQLIRFYWMNERRLYLWLYLGLTALFVFKEPLANVVFHAPGPAWNALLTSLFLCIGTSLLFAMLFTKRGAIDFLSLPAGNAEKFISRIVYGTLVLVLIAALANLTANCICLLFIWMMESLVGHPFPTDAANYYLRPDFLLLGGPWHTGSEARIVILFLLNATFLWTLILSLFTWTGLQVRRYGWAVGVLLILAFILLVELSRQIFCYTPAQARPFLKAIQILALVFYYLAYRAFSRSEVSNR